MIFTELDIIDSLVIGTINDLKYVVSLDMDDYEAVKRDASRVVAAFVKGSGRGAMTEELDAELVKMNGGQVRLPREDMLGKLGLKRKVKLYSQQAVETFFALTDECREHGRALGWDTGSFGDLEDHQRVINHTGYTGTSIQMNLDEGVAIIILTNRVHPNDSGAVGRTRATVANIISSAIN